jgi:outer membrane protein TolC
VPNPALPIAERIDSLEHAVQCAASANPFAAFSNLPFGRTNQVNLGVTLSQYVFSGGRVSAQVATANASLAAARIGLRSTEAQLVLDVTQAYYDAALTDRLLRLAEQMLAQADTTLKQTQLARKVGDKPEFDLLRAQVTRDNQLPIVIQRRSDRTLAYMRLKQLLSMPVDQPVALTTELNEDRLAAPVAKFVSATGVTGDTATSVRAPVRQAVQNVKIQRNQVKIARAQRWPSVGVASSFGRVTYPTAFAVPSLSQFNTNWTVSVSLQMPFFTGGRIHGDQLVANANYMQAEAQLEQTVQLAALDARSALERLNAAQAAWTASSGTVTQATRAYQIAEVRYREGISTQLELSDSQILLQQAEANRALTARDLQVARVRMALLPDLPLSAAGSNAAAAGQTGTSSPQQQLQQLQQQQQQQQQPRQQAPLPGAPPNTIATNGSGTGAQ